MESEHRPPLQGGLPPVDAVEGLDGAVVEIACDESGFSGTNLLDAATPLFTHASTDLTADEADDLVAALRSGSARPLPEVKSGPLLRGPGAVGALEPFLDALAGRAHVHVVDKELFLAARVVDLFLAEPSYAAGTRLAPDSRPAALALHRVGHAAGRAWPAFLAALVDLVRTKRRRALDVRSLDAFLAARDALLGAVRSGPPTEGADATDATATATGVLSAIDRARVADVVTRLVGGDRSVPPPLEPLLPALAETVLFWADGRRRVLVVHDEQSALTADRLRRLQDVLAVGGPTSPLAGLVTVDSRDDARVQVADLLAGAVRRSVDPVADPALRPFLSPTSPLVRPVTAAAPPP